MSKIKLSDGRIVETWPLHILGYGDAGAKKTTFFASMPKPMLVFSFDPWGKERPYLRKGRPADLEYDEQGTPIRNVYHPTKDEIIIRIEHYVDEDPYKPDAYKRYSQRMVPFARTREHEQYKTVGWDSTTFFGMSRRKWDEYVLNAKSKSGNTQDGKQWYGAEARAVEDELFRRATMLSCNTFVTAHVNDDKEDMHGRAILTPAAPGKLSRRMPAGFTELYHFYVKGQGKDREYLIQTQPNSMFVASSQIPAPDPMHAEAGYRGLWEGMEE